MNKFLVSVHNGKEYHFKTTIKSFDSDSKIIAESDKFIVETNKIDFKELLGFTSVATAVHITGEQKSSGIMTGKEVIEKLEYYLKNNLIHGDSKIYAFDTKNLCRYDHQKPTPTLNTVMHISDRIINSKVFLIIIKDEKEFFITIQEGNHGVPVHDIVIKSKDEIHFIFN